MNCEEILSCFPDALEGLLPAEGRRQAEEHLAGCPSCAAAWRGMGDAVREAGRALAGEPEAPEGAPPGYWRTFLPRVRARIAARRVPAREGWRAWAVPAAATLVLGFALGAMTGGLLGRGEGGAVAGPGPEVLGTAEYDPLTPFLEEALGSDWDLDRKLQDLTPEEQDLLLEELVQDLS